MAPPEKPETGSGIENMSEQPGFDDALTLCDKIFSDLKIVQDPTKVVVKENVHIGELLKFAKGLRENDTDSDDPVKDADFNHILEIKIDSETEELVIAYGKPELEKKIRKGEPLYEAIFWTPPETKEGVRDRTRSRLDEGEAETAEAATKKPDRAETAEAIANEMCTLLESGNDISSAEALALMERYSESLETVTMPKKDYLEIIKNYETANKLDRVAINLSRQSKPLDVKAQPKNWDKSSTEGISWIIHCLETLEISTEIPKFYGSFMQGLLLLNKDPKFKETEIGKKTIEHYEFLQRTLIAMNEAIEKERSTKIAINPESTIFLGDSITVGMKGHLGAIEDNSMIKGATSAGSMAKDFPAFLEKNKERIEKGELQQIVILAGYNDICNIEAQTNLSVEQKIDKIFESLEAIYKLALSQKPPLKVIACTLTQADFNKAVASIKTWPNWKDKEYPGDPERMRKIFDGLNKKIKAYPGITVIDLAEETKDKEKYPLRDASHHTAKGAENLAAYLGKNGGEITTARETTRQEYNTGEIHQKYDTLLASEKVKPHKLEDRKKLGGSTVKEIRYNHRFLLPKESEEKDKERISNLKQETARRIASYTNPGENDWHVLDYSTVGGTDHLYGIGLGDILLDPDIQEIWVEKNGEVIKGTRGLTSKGRQAFLDENDKYIATFDGDKFKIISKKEQGEAEYIKKLDQEIAQRKEHKVTYRVERDIKLSENINWREDAGKYKPTTDEFAIGRLNAAREENDGQQILSYAKECAEKFGIPWNVYKEIINVESGWNPGAKYSGHIDSDASGLGQFLSGTWKGFMKNGCKGKVLDSKWGSPEGSPIGQEHKFNPYACAYATAWLLAETKNSKSLRGSIEGKPEHEQAFIYYLAHNRGVGGANSYLKFIDQMKKNGHSTRGEIAAAYKKNPVKYALTLIGAHRRYIRKYGIQTFLNAYFTHSKKVALRTLANNPEALERVQKENPSKDREHNTYTETSISHRKHHPEKQYTTEYFDLKSAQEKWILGSSTAVGMDHHRSSKTGIYGISGISASGGNFLNRFKKDVGEHLKKNPEFKAPKEIILVGLGINGALPESKITSPGQLEANVEERIKRCKEIAEYFKNEEPFKGQGIKVKIATIQPYPKMISAITKFNERLREEFPSDQIIDLAAKITTEDNKWKPGMASGDNLHLSGRGKELLHSMIDEGTESTTSAISAQHALDNRLPLPPLNIKQSANEEGVTAETLRLAESECKRPVRKAMDVLKRKNYLKVVDLAAQRIGVPAYAILAVHYKETNHMFNDRAKGDKGSANGMGQLWWKYHSNPKGSWDYAKENGNFRTTMAQFTDDNYDNIEGSQSILADTLATASFLKRAASKFDMDISYTSVLTKEQLIDLRWGYHKPTTAGKEKYKAQREKKSYPKYADLALEYKSALG